MTKEQTYDAKINPLMAQIIAICQEHKIAALCTFAIPTEEDDGLQCSTNLPDETGAVPEHHARAFGAIQQGTGGIPPMMLTTEHSDGRKTITAILG